MQEKLLKVQEVAAILDLKSARIYELCRQDKNFPFILVGQRQYRFSKSALMSWIENGGNRKNEEVENNG